MTTEAGRRLMEALADEHCSIDSQGCHEADEVRAEEFVPQIEAEAALAERERIRAAVLSAADEEPDMIAPVAALLMRVLTAIDGEPK